MQYMMKNMGGKITVRIYLPFVSTNLSSKLWCIGNADIFFTLLLDIFQPCWLIAVALTFLGLNLGKVSLYSYVRL